MLSGPARLPAAGASPSQSWRADRILAAQACQGEIPLLKTDGVERNRQECLGAHRQRAGNGAALGASRRQIQHRMEGLWSDASGNGRSPRLPRRTSPRAGWAADIPFRRRVPHGSLRFLSNHGSDRRAAGAPTCPNSGNELIAAGLSYQELGMRGVLLDLLPQAVDVRLQRVRGDARVIAPYLLQQHVARHDLLASAIEILEDGGLLLREPDFGAFLVNQHLRCRLERVVANGEHR